MYIPARFEMADDAEKIALIKECDFGIVVTQGGSGLTASHVPFLLNEASGVLTFHLANANPQVQDLQSVDEVLVIFAGPHAYTSPTWYTDRTRVPTWNYLAVHVYGSVRELTEDAVINRAMAEMVEAKEGTAPGAWSVANVPAKKYEALKAAITVFECTIIRIEGKAKLDQNKPDEDRRNVADKYAEQGHSVLADKIRNV